MIRDKAESLVELAERAEQGPGDVREFFEDVFRAVFPKPERIWVTDNSGHWTPEYTAWTARQWRFYELLEAEGFLDAAMTLGSDDPVSVLYVASVRCPAPSGEEFIKALPRFVAAAALRAQAAIESPHD